VKVAVTALGTNLGSMSSPVFGRCPAYVFVDTETLQYIGIDNPCAGAGAGAGTRAARLMADRGVEAVLSLNVGPSAYEALRAAGIAIYRIEPGTVGQAVESFRAGSLRQLSGPNVSAYRGLGRGGTAE
jgi:predicted Fe-Mo cluster-binding NifX family protein